MTDQLAEISAAIAKADIAMKAAAWQIERLAEDVAMLRKALTELAYVAEENSIYLSNLTKSTQDTIVAMRLGGFR
jgi:K+-transporting ATPase c subunit